MYIKCYYSSQKGEFRENNEDNLYICGKWLSDGHISDSGKRYIRLKDGLLFGVFDGLGGELKGEVASFVAAKGLHNCKNIYDYFIDSNKKILEIEREGNKNVGSTAAIIRFEEGKYCVANLGDSRIYLVREGKAYRLTTDHTMAEAMIKAGVMTEEATRKNSFQNYLTQCLGGGTDEDTSEIEPYISEYEVVKEGDIFVLCSDGFWGAVSSEDMVKTLSEKTTNIADTLADMAYKNGAKDNVTVVVLYMNKDSFFDIIKNKLFSKLCRNTK